MEYDIGIQLYINYSKWRLLLSNHELFSDSLVARAKVSVWVVQANADSQ